MTIALVSGQTAIGNSTFGGATAVATLTSNPATNNLVIVGVISNASGTLTVADSNSNNYVATTSTPFNASSVQLGIFYLIAPANATNVITATRSAPNANLLIWVAEFSGTATASVLEADNTTNFGGPGTNINLPSLTTTNNGDLLIGIASGYSAMSTVNSPWTAISTAQGPGQGWVEYFVQTSSGSQAINFTQVSSANWDGMIAAFKASAGATQVFNAGPKWSDGTFGLDIISYG